MHSIGSAGSYDVEGQVKYFDDKFATLAEKAYQEVSRQMEPSTFLARVTYLPVSSRLQHRSFIKKYLTNIQNPITFEKIWSILNLYWDFLNYGLLKHVIRKFGSQDLKHQMQTYLDELSTFKIKTRLCDFINSWPCRDDMPPEEELRKVVVKMRQEWNQCTLQDVESFKSALIHKFFLPEFDIILKRAEKGCVCVTWLTSPSIATLLLQNLPNIETEFFKEHSVDAVTINGQDIYLTPVKKYGGYLRELYTSERPLVGVGPPTPTEKLLPFKLARIEKETIDLQHADHFTKRYIRGDLDDVDYSKGIICKKSPIKLWELNCCAHSSHQQVILIEGAPGVGKTTFSWEFSKKWSRGEILQDHSILLLLPLRDNRLKEAKNLSDLFYHPNSELQQAVVPEITSSQGKGVAIWLEAWDELDHRPREETSVFLDLIHGRILPLATVFVTSRSWASEHLREKCGHRISQHVEILTSAKDQIEHYISKAEAKAPPSSFATKFTDYLSSNPVIRAAMYTPVTAKISAEVFAWSQLTESPPPTTMTELFTTYTLKTLVGYVSAHPLYHKQQLKVTSFGDLPPEVYKQFQDLCRMAYEGILNMQQLVFSAAHLPTGFSPLGLMQEVPQVYTQGEASSYHFTHLMLQEFLSAVHISHLPIQKKTKLIQDHVHGGHFKMTMTFVAGLTKVGNIPPEITGKLREDRDNNLILLHWLFECKDTLVTTRILGSDVMVVSSHYSWTPLDYYVTGHVISHSNSPWRLYFDGLSIDNEKFELFCQGCATPEGTGCEGYISYAYFNHSDLTPKHIQSFASIPSHILQDVRKLNLNGNELDGSACDLLAKVIPSMSRLEEFWLGSNLIGSGGAVEVIKSLWGSRVNDLRLYNTGIGGPDCEALSKLLQSTHSLEWLQIGRNNLSSQSVASIITGLWHNTSLTRLDISNSHFSMANTLDLSSLLREHSRCTLTSLKVQDCHISSEGAMELAAALCKNTTLRILDLSGNPIGGHTEGVSTIAKLLIENKSLRDLWLEDCQISGQGVGKLAAALYKNSTLQILNLDFNPIGVKGASLMSDMVQHNTSLTMLRMRDYTVGKEGVRQLVNSVKYNQTLKYLWLPEIHKSETTDHRIHWG